MVELGYYRHFKGNLYEVIAIAKHSETQEEMVVYKSSLNEKEFWIRPLSMWKEVVVHNEKTLPRFEKINES